MVLTKPELIAALQNEVRILLHLAGKIDPAKLDYRPTPKQRSIVELLKYLSMMGPALVQAAKAGAFDGAAWTAAEQAAAAQSYEQALAAIAAQSRHLRGAAGRRLRRRPARRHRSVRRREVEPRRLPGHPGALRLRRLPHAVVPVPQGLRTRGTQHLEPLGGHRCTPGGLTRTSVHARCS